MTLLRLFAVSLLLLVGVACAEEPEIEADPQVEAEADPGDVETVENLVENPDDFVGEEVSVAAEVAEIIGPDGFVIERPDGFDQELIAVDVETAELEVNQTVDITGTFEEFNTAAINEKYGVSLDESTYANFEGEYGIVVSDLETRY